VLREARAALSCGWRSAAPAGDAGCRAGPRIEPPAGAIFGPCRACQGDPTVPPSVPREMATPELIVDLSVARGVDHLGLPGREHPAVRHVRPAGEIVVVVVARRRRDTVLRKQRFLGLCQHGRQALRRRSQPTNAIAASTSRCKPLLARKRRWRDPVAWRTACSPCGRSASAITTTSSRSAWAGRSEAARGALSCGHRSGHHPGRRFSGSTCRSLAIAGEGVYEIRIISCAEGKIVAAVSRPLPVGKVGFRRPACGWRTMTGRFMAWARF